MRPLNSLLKIALPLSALAAFSIYGHVRVVSAGEDYTGSLALLDRLFDLLLVAGLVGLSFCIGRVIARILSLSFAGPIEEFSFSVMLGVGTMATSILLLGLAGLLRWPAISALIISFIALTYREIARLTGLLKEAAAAAAATKGRMILALIFVALVAIMALRAMTPPHSADETIYHLSVAKSFVEEGRVFAVLDNWAGNIPFLMQMIYTVCLMAKADIATKLFSLSIAVIASLALYGFCRRFLNRRAGVVAIFGFFGAGMLVEVAITARIDVSLAGILFLAAYSMMTYLETKQRGWLYASAMLSGFGFATKYSAGIFILLLGVMYLVESLIRKDWSLLTVIRWGIIYTAILLLVISPWLIKNYVWFKNPIYPFVTGEVMEYAPGSVRYFNEADEQKIEEQYEMARVEMPKLTVEREKELAQAASLRVKRHTWRFWEYFTRPNAYNMSGWYDYPNYLFMLSPLVILFWRRKWLVWLALISAAFFLASTNTSWVSRILLPIFPPLTVISAYIITELAARADFKGRLRSRPPKAIVLPAVLVTVAAGYTALGSIIQFKELDGMQFITGNLSRSAFMSRLYYYPPTHFINNTLPEDARVLMIGAMNSYHLKRDYIADVNWDSTEWRRLLARNKTIERVNEDLKRQGVTHVWVAYGFFTFIASQGRENYPNVTGIMPKKGTDYHNQLRNWATIDLYRSKYLEEIYSDNYGNSIYRIK